MSLSGRIYIQIQEGKLLHVCVSNKSSSGLSIEISNLRIKPQPKSEPWEITNLIYVLMAMSLTLEQIQAHEQSFKPGLGIYVNTSNQYPKVRSICTLTHCI